MADDPKDPHARPPLADKGAARPLSRGKPGERKAADPSHDRPASGLHARPDLYGARTVIRRPVATPPEASDQGEPRPGREDEPGQPSAKPERDTPGLAARNGTDRGDAPIGDPATCFGETRRIDQPSDAPKAPGPDETPSDASPPAANLLDHPPRIPDSVSFEEWTDAPDSEPEEGARTPDAAPSAVVETESHWPGPSDDPADAPARVRAHVSAHVPADVSAHGPAHASAHLSAHGPARVSARTPVNDPVYAPVEPGRTPNAPDEEVGPAGRLLARLSAAANVRRLREDRWPVAVAAAVCAVLLLGALIGGVIKLPGDDQDAGQLARGLDQPESTGAPPASAESAVPSETAQQDVPVAPAGNPFGSDRPARPGPERSGAMIADRTGNPQIAALPDTRESGPPERTREPIVDFMRIDPDGKAVVAGRAAPGTELIVLDNGAPLGEIKADIYGLWTFVSQHPLTTGRHEIGLRVKRQGSEVSDPVLVTDGGASPPLESDLASRTQVPTTVPATDDAGRQDPAASDQLAAAAPQAPIQSDESTPEALAKATDAGAEDTLETAAAAAEPAAGGTDRSVEGTATQTGAVGATEAAPAPAPKPEPPEAIQTAAVDPAGGDYVIQLASFKNPETAVREQTIVEEQFTDLLAGHEVFVQQVDLAEQGTYYRVRLGPFASLEDARAACARFQERDRECLALAR